MLADAVKAGRRQGLEALRDTLTTAIEAATPRETALLVKELRAVLLELETLPVEQEQSPFDEIADRRAARRAASHPSDAKRNGRRTSKRGA